MCKRNLFFARQVLKELGIEDPLLNVAQELEKVDLCRDLWLQKRCEKNVVVLLTLEGPQNYEKCRFYTPENMGYNHFEAIPQP